MAYANMECPPPDKIEPKKRGKKKKGKERALIDRLIKLKDSVCLFIHNFLVPFDNNQAERDLRNVKTKAKVSGCFRTKAGAQTYLKITSYYKGRSSDLPQDYILSQHRQEAWHKCIRSIGSCFQRRN